jgi:hypothetical protein
VTERDERLDAFVSAYAARVERDVVRAAPVPDIADVWARVREIDEDAVPPDLAVEDGDDDAAVVPLARARAMQASQSGTDHALAPFAAALRERVEQRLQERGLAEIPSRRLRIARVSASLVALAAAVVLAVLGGLAVVRDRVEGTNTEASRIHGRMLAEGSWIPRDELHAIEQARADAGRARSPRPSRRPRSRHPSPHRPSPRRACACRSPTRATSSTSSKRARRRPGVPAISPAPRSCCAR